MNDIIEMNKFFELVNCFVNTRIDKYTICCIRVDLNDNILTTDDNFKTDAMDNDITFIFNSSRDMIFGEMKFHKGENIYRIRAGYEPVIKEKSEFLYKELLINNKNFLIELSNILEKILLKCL